MQQQADIGGGGYQSKTHDARGTSKYYNEQNLRQQHRLVEDEEPIEESEEQILAG